MSTAPASFTRPADTTAYASGDLVANSTTAGSVSPLTLITGNNITGGDQQVRRVRLRKTGTGVTNAAFRVHLYSSAPTVANGDNGAWSSTPAASWLGSLDVTIDKAFTDGAAGVGAPAVGSEIAFSSAGSLYALVEARGAYTPASAEVFTVEAEIQSVR